MIGSIPHIHVNIWISIPHIHKWFSSLSLPKPIVYDVGLVIEND